MRSEGTAHKIRKRRGGLKLAVFSYRKPNPQPLIPSYQSPATKKAAREAVRRFASFHSRRAEHDGEIVEISAEWFFLFFCLFVGKNAHAASVHTDERSGLSPEKRSHRARAQDGAELAVSGRRLTAALDEAERGRTDVNLCMLFQPLPQRLPHR